jgi:hypothetical protein
MNVYRDSAASMNGQPPPIPGDLVEKLSINRANTGSDGRYVFQQLPPGPYLVATELRDEYRWVPVEVKRSAALADRQAAGLAHDLRRGPRLVRRAKTLIAAQRDERIHARRATRRNVGRQ